LGTACGRRRSPNLSEVGPAMEGTSGAADRDSLRGEACDAALGGGACQKRAPSGGLAKPLRFAGAHCSAAVSTLRRNELATGGVRAVSGWGEAPASSDRRGRRRAADSKGPRHGPWPVASRLAAVRTGDRESVARPRRGRRKPPFRKTRKPPATTRCARGRPRARSAGFGRCAVVLADRCFGCRSRRATRGSSRPGVKSPWTRGGSSPQRESSGGERASEAGSRAANPRDRWRARSVRESGLSGAFVDGRRPGPGKPHSLTRRRWKRSWCFAEVRLVRAEAGRETGRQRFSRRPCSRLKTPWQGGAVR